MVAEVQARSRHLVPRNSGAFRENRRTRETPEANCRAAHTRDERARRVEDMDARMRREARVRKT